MQLCCAARCALRVMPSRHTRLNAPLRILLLLCAAACGSGSGAAASTHESRLRAHLFPAGVQPAAHAVRPSTRVADDASLPDLLPPTIVRAGAVFYALLGVDEKTNEIQMRLE